MKRAQLSASDISYKRCVFISFKECHANMHELLRAVIIPLFVLHLYTVYCCELFGRFDMPSLFRQGDIMIGGIFPVSNKEISDSSTFESRPSGVKCAG